MHRFAVFACALLATAAAFAGPQLAPPDDAQRAAAELPHYGRYACEFKQSLSVERNARHEGYVDVRFGKQVFVMKPVVSSTGAVRLEDVNGEMLMVQIPFKSMLLNARQGRRIVDECVHDKQLLARRAAELAPPQPGLGIDPARAAPVPEAPASAGLPS